MLPADAFLAEIEKKRAKGGALSPAKIELELKRIGPRQVSLSKLRAYVQWRGDGKAALRRLVEIADKHGVWLSLYAVADYHLSYPGSTDPVRLRRFYAGAGFVPESGNIMRAGDAMVRPPRGTLLIDRPELLCLARLPSWTPDAIAIRAHLDALFGVSEVDLALGMILEEAA